MTDTATSPSKAGWWIEANNDDFDAIPEGLTLKLARVTPATPEDAQFVLEQSTEGDDGRSEWVWIRLPEGTLALAVFPQGDTYMEISEPGKAPFWP